MSSPASLDERALKARVHRRLVEDCDADLLHGLERGPTLEVRLAELIRDEAPLLPAARVRALVRDLTHEVVGLGPLEPLLADPEVTEVMCNGPGRVWVERAGRLERVEVEVDGPTIARLVERAITPLGLRWDRAAPILDARLPDGSRLHAVAPPLAVDGPYLTIRRFGTRVVPLEAFGADAGVRGLLQWMVKAGWNLLVSGGTSSGKTTLLNALSGFIPAHERIVTIEETAELRLTQPHVVRLEARPANAEGAGAASLRDLVRASLRMRPDRLVVGEVRGPEALDMVEALNTGHDGSLSTIHANGPIEALLRLEALALRAASLPAEAIRAHIAASIDAVVHVARRSEGRLLEAVAEVGGGPAGLATRELWERGRPGLRPPTRRPRRPTVEVPW